MVYKLSPENRLPLPLPSKKGSYLLTSVELPTLSAVKSHLNISQPNVQPQAGFKQSIQALGSSISPCWTSLLGLCSEEKAWRSTLCACSFRQLATIYTGSCHRRSNLFRTSCASECRCIPGISCEAFLSRNFLMRVMRVQAFCASSSWETGIPRHLQMPHSCELQSCAGVNQKKLRGKFASFESLWRTTCRHLGQNSRYQSNAHEQHLRGDFCAGENRSCKAGIPVNTNKMPSTSFRIFHAQSLNNQVPCPFQMLFSPLVNLADVLVAAVNAVKDPSQTTKSYHTSSYSVAHIRNYIDGDIYIYVIIIT